MEYRATLTVDFTNSNPNNYQKLLAALIAIGWKYQETSALSIDTNSLASIWGALDLIARQSASAGELSALTIHVQGSANSFQGSTYSAAANHPHAKDDIQKKPFPSY